MIHKFTFGIASLMITATLGANAGTGASDTPANLAKQQVLLSKKLVSNYVQNKDISKTITKLENKQNKLSRQIQDPELNNLLKFMNICLNNIKTLSVKPHNHSNRQRIADLSSSIGEGSRYILNSIR